MKRATNLIALPSCIYVFLIALFFSFQKADAFATSTWSDHTFDFLVYVAPLLSLMISISWYKKLEKNPKESVVFLLGAVPGFFPGAIFGYGLWGMGHGDTIVGFLLHIAMIGLPVAIVFGTLGSLYDFTLRKLMR